MAERIKVYIRIRPSVSPDSRDLRSDSSTTSDDSAVSAKCNFEYTIEERKLRLRSKHYELDGIFPPSTQQSAVYDKLGRDEIETFFQGFNTTIFAYGQTGSGKSHTIFGPHENAIDAALEKERLQRVNAYGLVPRCYIAVFQRLQTKSNICKYQIDLSCVEVYNTVLRDLFNPNNSARLRIREDIKNKFFFVENLSQESVESVEEMLLFIKRIEMNRAVCSTNMNENSSRSHIILQLRLIQQSLSGETKQSLLTFVDLAGSEMVRKTGTEGLRLKEAGHINGSLSTLSRCIDGLSSKNKNNVYIPFRDSNLTKLLKVSLGGNCRTSLIVCVSGERQHKEETYSSLRFATRALCVQNQPTINKVLDAQQLHLENVRLKDEVERLQAKLNEQQPTDDLQAVLAKRESELEDKAQQIERLNGMLDDLQWKLDKSANAAAEEDNMKLKQSVSRLEIELQREVHSNAVMQQKLNDLQLSYSDMMMKQLAMENECKQDGDILKEDDVTVSLLGSQARRHANDTVLVDRDVQTEAEDDRDVDMNEDDLRLLTPPATVVTHSMCSVFSICNLFKRSR